MVIKLMKLTINNINLNKRDISKIRGFIARKYSEYDKLHNHNGKRFIYRYPLIQYKVINNKPCIIGINEGINVLNEINYSLSYFDISNSRLDILEKIIKVNNYRYGITKELIKYQFISPWMCLNKNNYKEYKNINDKEKEELLKRILIGNIISMSKGLNYTVNDKIRVNVNLKQNIVKFKKQNMLCFIGNFETNFVIPNELGIGKSVSRGFGTIVKE